MLENFDFFRLICLPLVSKKKKGKKEWKVKVVSEIIGSFNTCRHVSLSQN